jgi:GNAT superfamily N-acetyltransferase
MAAVGLVTAGDLDDLLPLMRGYLEFYKVDPSDDAVLEMSRTLLADPDREGVQLIARAGDGTAIGFATILWTWSTLSASRIGVMNDLFVSSGARGTGAADALIAACVDHCRERGDIAHLGWQTAKDNHRAQAVYERAGGKREEWLDYSLDTSPA